MTTTAPPPSTAFEVRFDALVTRMRALARVAGGGSIGNELADLADEMVRVRRDMAYFVERAQAEIERRPVVETHPAIVVEPEPARRPYSPRGTSPHAARSANPGRRNGGARQGTQKIRGRFVKLPEGKRWCGGHNDGEGAMLDVSAFRVKTPRTGALKSWCEPCSRKYQQDRYVRLGYKRVTVEVSDGDACVGHACPKCGKPFVVGQRVQGENVAHEACYA